MAQHKFSLKYPDGRTRHIDAETRDSFLFAGLIRETSPGAYLMTEKPKVFHSFAEIGELRDSPTVRRVQKTIPGNFVVERAGKRFREWLETAEGLELRMAKANA